MVSFQINIKTLPPLEAFPYLGRTIAYNNSNWAAVYLNLWKSWRWCGVIERVIERMGSRVRSRRAMYKAVVQLVLLYGNYSCVVTGEMLKVLKAFRQRAARQITGMTAKGGAGREW